MRSQPLQPSSMPSLSQNSPSPTALPFAKVVPGGNPTLLIPASATSLATLPHLSQKLMHPNHVEAEQVGSLAFSAEAPSLPHLQMMGGEFCVNATRASASLLANAGQLMRNEQGCHAGHMSVSGSPEPILVATAPTSELLHSTISQLQSHEHHADNQLARSLPSSFSPCPSCLSCPPYPMGEHLWPQQILQPTLYAGARLTCPVNNTTFGSPKQSETVNTLVHLPGISHLLIPTSLENIPDENQCRSMSAHYRAVYGLESLHASGTIWYYKTPQGFAILPAVYVKDTNSLCLETACGSASLALALYRSISAGHYDSRPESSYAIRQPSGETLTVIIARHSSALCHAWVMGPSHIVALGTAYLS